VPVRKKKEKPSAIETKTRVHATAGAVKGKIRGENAI